MGREITRFSQPQTMTSESDPIPRKSREPSSIGADLNLAKAISGGSVSAWHKFLNRYSGLIYGVVRRHLFTEDEDEVRGAYVDILKCLYDGEIKNYRGESHLTTWLMAAVRSRTLDLFRKRHGRLRLPRGYKRLSELDKKVLRFYFVERLPLEIVVHMLGWSGFSVNADDIIKSIQRIENIVGRCYLDGIDHERRADQYGVDSIQVLKYLIQMRLEYEEKASSFRTESYLLEKEVLEKTDRLRELLSALTPEERKIVFLRFNRGWSARKIAKVLDLGGQRRAYTIIDRVIRKLRRSLSVEGDR
jgi:RNA polymerase sigma factor (sigma-70 family)